LLAREAGAVLGRLVQAVQKTHVEHSVRVHPLYFHYLFEKADDVHIELPLGWQVRQSAAGANNDAKAIAYSLKVENNKGSLTWNGISRAILPFWNKNITVRCAILSIVRSGDDQQIVLQPWGPLAEIRAPAADLRPAGLFLFLLATFQPRDAETRAVDARGCECNSSGAMTRRRTRSAVLRRCTECQSNGKIKKVERRVYKILRPMAGNTGLFARILTPSRR